MSFNDHNEMLRLVLAATEKALEPYVAVGTAADAAAEAVNAVFAIEHGTCASCGGTRIWLTCLEDCGGG